MRLVALVLLTLGFACPLQSVARATLWVEVVSQDTGAPIPGVQLVITRAGVRSFSVEGVEPLEGRLGKAPSTGSDGRARFRLRPGAYSLCVTRDSPKRWIEVPELADGEERTLRVALPTLDDLRYLGRVVTHEPGGTADTPLAGAEVLLFEGSGWSNAWQRLTPLDVVEEVARTTTDADGCFEVLSASWKNRMVRVRAAGRTPAYLPVVPGHSEPEQRREVRLEPTASLIARVEHEGELPSGTTLHLFHQAAGTPGSVIVGADGTCRLDDLPAELPLQVQLSWSPPDVDEERAKEWFQAPYPSQRLEHRIREPLVLVPGEVATRTFRLPPRCTLAGVVLDTAGRPLPGLLLRLERADSTPPTEPREFSLVKYPDLLTTDAAGAFRIADLPGETSWYLGPDPGDREHAELVPEGTPLTLPAGAREHRVELRARTR
jgi:hypothetical protein